MSTGRMPKERKLRFPFIGFFFLFAALGLLIAAFILHFETYAIFGYTLNRWVVFLTVASFWFIVFLLVNGCLAGEKPFWTYFLYAALALLITFAAVLFIQPCLAPMGIYFTVNNMGDVEANAAGVPRAIVTTVLYVVALIFVLIAAFTPTVLERSFPQAQAEKPAPAAEPSAKKEEEAEPTEKETQEPAESGQDAWEERHG